MTQVSADPIDIRRAFQRHQSSFEMEGLQRRPRLVSLFYTAECGLKYLIMTSQSLTTTGHLRDALVASLGIPRKEIDLHNIEQLCLSANLLPVDIGNAPTSFMKGGNTFLPYKIHEAARYGVKVSDAYLTSVETWLQNIVDIVNAQIVARGI